MRAALRLAVLTRNSSLLPLALDFSAYANGAIPAVLTGANASITSGKLVITPTSDADLVSNGSMETGNPPTGWTVQGTPTTYEQSTTQKVDGAASLHVVADAASEGGRQILTVVNGEFYRASVQRYRVSGAPQLVFASGLSINQSSSGNTGAWAEFVATEQATGAAPEMYLRLTGGAGEAYFDVAKVEHLVRSGVLALANGGRADVIVKAGWTIASGFQAGVIARADSASNPQNMIICYHNRTNLIVRKLVAGTWSAALLNTAVTYAAGADIELRCSGATVQAFYNGAQVGTDLTISDASILSNTLHGVISSDVANQCSSLAVLPN